MTVTHLFTKDTLMDTLAVRVPSFFHDESGAVAAEYTILVAVLVALLAIAAANLEDSLSLVLHEAAECVEVSCM